MLKKSCFKFFGITMLMIALLALSACGGDSNLDKLNGTWKAQDGITFDIDSKNKLMNIPIMGLQTLLNIDVLESADNKITLKRSNQYAADMVVITITDDDNIIMNGANYNRVK